MTRRDYFAAQALNALLTRDGAEFDAMQARCAFEIADAMIAVSPPDARRINEMAYQVADGLELDLKSRQGLCHAWTDCSEETRKIVKDEWVALIRREIRKYFNGN